MLDNVSASLVWALAWFVAGALLLIVYLAISGWALNRLFRREIRRCLESAGDSEPRAIRWLGHVYGVHLVLLIVAGYSLLLVVTLPLLAVFLGSVSALFSPHSTPVIAAPVALIPGVCLFGGLWRGLFVRGKPPLAVPLDEAAEPAIWALSRSVAAEVGTRPADRIVLDPWTVASVHEDGSLLRALTGRTRRVLTLGAPMLMGLSVTELRSILLHEYAHFARADTSWGRSPGGCR